MNKFAQGAFNSQNLRQARRRRAEEVQSHAFFFIPPGGRFVLFVSYSYSQTPPPHLGCSPPGHITRDKGYSHSGSASAGGFRVQNTIEGLGPHGLEGISLVQGPTV
ncbi:hypothetical protein ABZX51_004027 [Aspergillus tubingensis]